MVVQIKIRFDLSFESDRYFTEYVGVHPYVTHVPFVRLLQWFFFRILSFYLASVWKTRLLAIHC